MEKDTNIGMIGNYYGGLHIVERDGKYTWYITDYDYDDIQEIPKYLYDALLKFQQEDNSKYPILDRQ